MDEVRGHIHRLERDGLACTGFEGLAEVKTTLHKLSAKVEDLELVDVVLSGKEAKHIGVDKSLIKDVSVVVAETGDCIRKDICRYDKNIGIAVKMIGKNVTALNMKIDTGLESMKAVLGRGDYY